MSEIPEINVKENMYGNKEEMPLRSVELTQSTIGKLRVANLAAMLLHIIIGVVVVVWFSTAQNRVPDAITNALYTIGVKKSVEGTACDNLETIGSDSKQGAWCIGAKESKPSDGTLIIGLIITFVFFTAFMHFFYAVLGSSYNNLIHRKNNYFRWIEYAISATIMIIIVAISSGVKDLDVILMIVCVIPALMLIGNTVEVALAAGSPIGGVLSGTIAGWLILGGVFLVLLRSFADSMMTASDSGYEVPKFVPAVVGVTLLLFASFGVVQILQMTGFYAKRGGYPAVEMSYIVLSFISKALLALLVASGLVARSVRRDEDVSESMK
jgi:hypothetical protein